MTVPNTNITPQILDPFEPSGRERALDFWTRWGDQSDRPELELKYTPEFFFAAQELLSRRDTVVRLVLLERDSAPFAMFPVEIALQRHLPGKIFRFLHHPARLSGAGVLVREQDLPTAVAALLAALHNEYPRAASFSLEGLDMDAPLYDAISANLSSHQRLEREPKTQLYIDLEEFSDIDAYYESRSRHYKKNFRSGRNRLNKMGGYEYSDSSPVGAWQFDDMRRIDRLTWRADEKEGDTPELLLKLCQELSGLAANPDDNMLCALSMEGRPVSMYYSLAHCGVKYVFKNTFDPEFAFASPSVVAFHHVVEMAIKKGLNRVELMAGNAYARPWANRERRISDDLVFFDSMCGRVAQLTAFGKQSIRKIVTKTASNNPQKDRRDV